MAHSLAQNNPPCRVLFAGFESDTFTLGRCGWQIAFEEQQRSYSKLLLILKHRSGLTGWAESLERFSAIDWRMSGQRDHGLPVFEVKQMSNSLVLRMMTTRFDPESLTLADTDYSMSKIEEMDLARLPLFNPVAQPAKEDLIVDPLTVSEMLEQIRQRQAPMQQEIRERARRREIVPIQHATIYTLPQAA